MTITELKDQLFFEVSDLSTIQEIRIRAGQPVILQVSGKEHILPKCADRQLIQELMERFSRYSLYAYEEEIRQGFLTIEGGHRIGIVGKVSLDEGKIRTMKYISGLNIRLAHECIGCADSILPWIYEDGRLQNTLFLSPPGGGKTTMLRDVVRQISNGNRYGQGVSVSVVDERSELASCFQGIPQCDLGMRTDVLDGCPKVLGMNMVIRSMNPAAIAVDEIGTLEDCRTLQSAIRCGCRIIATVHGDILEDLKHKPVLKEMVCERIFERYVVLGRVPAPGTIDGIYNGALERIC